MQYCHSCSVVSTERPIQASPALLTRTSTRPNLRRVASTTCSMSSRRETSAGVPRTSTPWPSITRTASSRPSFPRAQIETLAPSFANSSAMASPSPLLAPVTSATLPVRPRSMTNPGVALHRRWRGAGGWRGSGWCNAATVTAASRRDRPRVTRPRISPTGSVKVRWSPRLRPAWSRRSSARNMNHDKVSLIDRSDIFGLEGRIVPALLVPLLGYGIPSPLPPLPLGQVPESGFVVFPGLLFALLFVLACARRVPRR